MQKAISRRKFLKYGLYSGAAWGLAGALLPGGCTGRGKKKKPNVVIISIDTLRADHVSCYGYKSNGQVTPNIDRLASQGTRFSNAFTTITTTLPAHGSLMSSLYPSQLAARRNGERILQGVQTLAEVLQAAGYNTAAFVSAVVLDSRYGLNQGFVTYDDISAHNARLIKATIEKTQQRRWNNKLNSHTGTDQNLLAFDALPMGTSRPAEQTIEQTQAWLQENKKDSFFLFVHLYDPHTPYHAPEPYRRRFGAPDMPAPHQFAFVTDRNHFTPRLNKRYIAAYDAEIAYADWAIGKLLDQLEKFGLDDNTIVVLLSDHGETLDELLERYGYAFDHGEFLYAHQLHIPLIIRMPKTGGSSYNSGTVCDKPASIIDVMPTILNALAVETENPMMGSSLLPMLHGQTVTPRAIFSERRTFEHKPRPLLRGNDYSIIEKQWHLLYSTTRQAELYNMSEDPLEFVNLAVDSTVAPALSGKVQQWANQLKPMFGPGVFETDKQAIEALRSLGYIE